MKMSKEPELVRALQKLDYGGPELNVGDDNPLLHPTEAESGDVPE
jgi:hypothetical protein